MIRQLKPDFALRLWLWLMTAHSAAVGAGLLLHPPALLTFLGYSSCMEPFFAVQGGVFHFIMAVGYSMGAKCPASNRQLILFAIIVKTLATVFLIVYWVLNPVLLVALFSGVGDGVMALVLYVLYHRWCNLRTAKELL